MIAKERVGEREEGKEKEGERNVSSVGLLHKWRRCPGIFQIKTRSQEMIFGSPNGFRGTKTRAIFCWLSQMITEELN